MKVGSPGFQPDNPMHGVSKNGKKEVMQNIAQDSFSFSRSMSLSSRIYHQKIAENLPFKTPEPVKSDNVFDFEEVAKNVLNFVKGAILGAKADGADDEQLKSMFEQARSGIAKGMQDAYDELKGSDLLNDEIEQGIDKSKAMIFDGIDEFEESLFNPQPQSVQASLGQSYRLENNAHYTIETAEGDKVTLTFNSSYASSQAGVYQKSGDQERFAYQSETSSSMSYSFSIEGDLNEQEKEAINAMMEDLQAVSDEFFNGSLDEAFEQAKSLSIDSPQLVAMSMNLQQTEVRSSVKQYQQSVPGLDLAKKFESLNEGLTNAFEKAKPLQIEQELANLLGWLNETSENAENLLDYSKAFFDKLATLPEQRRDAPDS